MNAQAPGHAYAYAYAHENAHVQMQMKMQMQMCNHTTHTNSLAWTHRRCIEYADTHASHDIPYIAGYAGYAGYVQSRLRARITRITRCVHAASCARELMPSCKRYAV